MANVETKHPFLHSLIDSIESGDIVIPDFQRSFVWEPEAVRELLVSIVAGYYIGALLSLNVQKSKSEFAIKLVEGVEKNNPKAKISSIVKVMLDGQQRISSLYYAFKKPDMGLKNQKNRYFFFLDIDLALKGGEESINDAVIGVSSNHKNKLEEVYNNKSIVEFSQLTDTVYLHEKFQKHKKVKEIIKLAESIKLYELTIIEMPSDTSPVRIVETFERINRTGKPLSIFELLTARLYNKGVKLRDLLEKSIQSEPLLKIIQPETILRIMVLIQESKEVKEPNKEQILKLKWDTFEKNWERACEGLVLACNKLTNIKTGYGVIDLNKWMPYQSMLVPLSALLLHLKETKKDNNQNYIKLDKWYWTSVFNETYEQSTNSVSKQDYEQMMNYFSDSNKIPKSIIDFDINNIDLTVESQGSAVYRGIMCMITKKGAFDFKTGQEPKFSPSDIQDDHIFPKSIFKENKILNRTLITKNQHKSDNKPSKYFKNLEKNHSIQELQKILDTHIISDSCYNFLLTDDLDNFLIEREKGFRKEIEYLTV